MLNNFLFSLITPKKDIKSESHGLLLGVIIYN